MDESTNYFSTPIFSDSYDAVCLAGGMREGHIPAGSITEMARVVKPGNVQTLDEKVMKDGRVSVFW